MRYIKRKLKIGDILIKVKNLSDGQFRNVTGIKIVRISGTKIFVDVLNGDKTLGGETSNVYINYSLAGFELQPKKEIYEIY